MRHYGCQAFSKRALILLTDRELLERFFAATKTMTAPARAALIGVSESTVSRWKTEMGRNALRPLSEANNARIRDYLLGAHPEQADAAIVVLDEIQAKLNELRERLTKGSVPGIVNPEDLTRTL